MATRRGRIDFDVVRKIASGLPNVEELTTSRGTSLTVSGRLLACPAIHASAEPNSLMVQVSFDERARLLEEEPRIYYVTDHYASYPAVLVRLSQVTPESLRHLLEGARQFAIARPPTPKKSPR